MAPKGVLFLCTHNSARSQMAEGLLRHRFPGRFEAYSAGTDPTTLDPCAVRVMAEIGIDISGQRAKSLVEVLDLPIETVVTVCDRAQETCPFFPGAKETLHVSFPDPGAVEGEGRQEAFRRARDEIADWVGRTFGR
ncbi:MAG TPA: arsenate reductase ArsC [Methanoregulaceae archaeon]|nr:arsenate reductase ArsC [Methanoregulaceae archaeon]